ncbi:BTAD domain-containing putative transcriptional regulator [Membranihabitans marinus]|uniref:BTAD domain-containing putative transcriptional regulator n=1 Tax=Nesterenkonia rhizosphaerae TaxID=1348272 RepID=A0ABP9FX59_9MICC
MLGPVQLGDDDAAVVEVPERKVRALLAALTAAGGATVSVDALIDSAWGVGVPSNPQRVLQAKLSQLRSLLDAASSGGRSLLVRSPSGYRLAVTAQNCDATEFRLALSTASALPAGRQRAELLESALNLWRGSPYGEFTDELWLTAEVAGLQEARIQAVELCAEAWVAAGAPEKALALAAPYFAKHPTREGLAKPLLMGNYLTRRLPEALAVYERVRSHLADEFGVDPSPELKDLHLSTLRQDPQIDPPGRSEGLWRQSVQGDAGAQPPCEGRLPSYSSPFLGRADEVRDVRALLAKHRLVTLLGIGGIGKTRLAVQVAGSLAAEQKVGTWFVDLTEVPRHGSGTRGEPTRRVEGLTAAAIGLTADWQNSSDLSVRIAAALEDRQALLVLDNCEHIIDEVAAFADGLMRRVPGVRILATSREPMSLAEEQRYLVPQLPVNVGTGPAVEFFLTRAQAVSGGVEADSDTVEAAAELCRRLDGLPLALELAAARTSTLSVPELLEWITDRLDLLARPDRAAPRRQQTLRGMLDWSWSLLQEEDRVLLRRLAVHPVTWRLEVIEQVCSDTQKLPRRRVLPVLAGLVDRSLVTTVHVDGRTSYRLLETVGAYAAEKLSASGERDIVAGRHLAYHRNLVDCAQGYLFGPRTREWMQRLDEARPHLSRAVDEALLRQDGANAVALVLATFWFRWMTGRIGSLIQELAAASDCPNPGQSSEELNAHAQVVVLARTVEDTPRAAKVKQLLAALDAFSPDQQGQLARMQVQWFAASAMFGSAEHRDRGRQLADEAIQYLLAAGETRAAAFASTQRDWFLLEFWNMPPQGMPCGFDAEQILRSHGDDYGLTQALGVQHLWAETEGRHEEAQQLADEVTSLSSRLDLDGEAAFWHSIQAVLRLRAGDLIAAQEQLEHSRQLAKRVAFVYCMRLNDAVAAMLAERRGEDREAVQALERFSAEEKASTRRALVRYFREGELPAPLRLSAL